MFKKIIFIIIIIIISGMSGIIANRYFFPYLSSTEFFAKNKFLKRFATDVTIINKTEQVFVKEDSTVSKLASQATASVVNIISYDNADNKIAIKSPLKNFQNGTGIIVTSDGMIMTYASAIIGENAQHKVLLADGSSYDAKLFAIDSYSNLAFLKIEASNLPSISFGNSDDVEAGEKIVAIGNNMESYQNRYASGLLNEYNPTFNISGKALSVAEKMEGVFEADFNNEENFVGGPIIDYSGQAIGITGSVLVNNQLEYFQIPSNKANAVLQKVIKQEVADNAQLGIYYFPITKAFALANNLKVEKGAQISSLSGQSGLAIISNSPAAKAGLRMNDIITAVAGQEITANSTLPDLLYKYKKGDNIELTVLRDGQEIKVSVQL